MSREQQTAIATITPTEAIRRAMAALGTSGQVPDILDYIREHFGITGVTPPEEAEAESASAPAPRAAPMREPEREALPKLEPVERPASVADVVLEPVAESPKAPPLEVIPPAEPTPAPAADAGKKAQAKRLKPKDRPSD